MRISIHTFVNVSTPIVIRCIYISICLFVIFNLPACDGGSSDTEQRQNFDPGNVAKGNGRNETPDITNGANIIKKCQNCHNENAINNNPHIPHISGQIYTYLLQALQAYQTSARKHVEMIQSVAPLSEPELVFLANHFSTLAAAWPVQKYTRAPLSSKPDESLIEKGRQLASPCLSCHGDNGNSKQAGVPKLAGLEQNYIEAALRSYFQGTRNNDIMKVFKHSIDENEIKALAVFFSEQERSRTTPEGNGNISAGKKIADKSCAGCHGPDGNSLIADFPSLAAQDYKYLTNAIIDYKTGQRKHQLMSDALKPFSKIDIRHLASYYASQSPEKQRENIALAGSEDPMQVAQYFAKSCFSCHGKNGRSSLEGTPHLVGLNRKYLQESINRYADGSRRHIIMKTLVERLSPMATELVSIYFASQQPTGKSGKLSSKDVDKPASAASCESCHVPKGNSTSAIPAIAGQDKTYMINVLNLYKSGARQNNDMQKATADLSENDIGTLANYFSIQSPTKPDIKLPKTADALARQCERCHIIPDSDNKANAPIIAGQTYEYLYSTLLKYQSRQWENSAMFAMTEPLTLWEIDQIARYFSQQSL